MKMTMTAVGVLVAAALLVSCGTGGTDGTESKAGGTGGYGSEQASVSPKNLLEGLELNQGQKWQMDDHTRSSFAEMATSYLALDHASLDSDGLKQAGADLQVGLNGLIKGCTMSGAAHDQLHVYLMGYMPAVAALSESGQMGDARKVKFYLEKYGEYFE